ncbi:DNA mismatch repair endonuclease MutL [Geobacter sp. SVR]|uniref:DNA mismatch repair endonuclease MutL n=1 Tax=Geobacter sp. SVR TaxID=2495594 RepID=UPI00143EF90B|nr:DNA mismatch repair endonuclease MutL [Geobacter sp. SVR]BCS55360.1 DNA mismatch repair protein MutL [Geobacter sp. SVR]GCF87285.1 DNA mismatch repair protein MutL [Geobacter sp. SVR]
MSQRITILPEIITNKIAAGEVVERPASVIKELVENALDAGATEISVEIAAGGRRLIRITDNGHGMSREDALLSLERHATSKIRNDSDLDGILTLGFRGEALPSIASVSRFRLSTREADSLEGTEITVEGGRVRDVKACGMAPGTVICVEQLFFNTPARLKFLRSAETEAGHVGDCISRMAISRPDVSFRCTSEGRELLRVQRGDLLRRLSQALGRITADNLYPVEHVRDDITVTGFISGPSAVRSTTAAMFTYINGRFVRDRVVQHAIMQACRGVIDRGRYPVCALFITIPAGEVDVNVHPTKHEVRFRRQTEVHDTIQAALEEVLSRSPWLAGRQQPAAPPPSNGQAYRERIMAAAQASLDLPRRERPLFDPQPAPPAAEQPRYMVSPTEATEDTAVREPAVPFQPAPTETPGNGGYFSSLSVIGQFHAEYILCQSGAELVIIDQHAASERVAYQRLRRQCAADGVESQRLLFPETLELSFSEAAAAQRFAEDLNRIGLELAPFGGNTVIVSAIPRIAAATDTARLVRDMLEELAQLGTTAAFREVEENLLARIACHSVIRGMRQLEQRQIAELLRSMDETDFAASCPHGRPVSHTITHAELEKIFHRT